MLLTSEEKIRYQRQMMIPHWDEEGQLKLKNSTVFIAGAGGLGSPLLYYLAVAGIGTLRVCDFDAVELSNLNRQILHSTSRIGMNKARSAQLSLGKANEHSTIEPIQEKIDKTNAAKLIGGADLIVDCLDNFDTRHILNRISVEMRIPLIHAGVEGFRGQITFLNPPHTPCLACFIPQKVKKEKFPIVGATAGILGTIQAMEAIKHLTGIGETLKNRLLLFDGTTMEFSAIKLTKNQKCSVCGKMR